MRSLNESAPLAGLGPSTAIEPQLAGDVYRPGRLGFVSLGRARRRLRNKGNGMDESQAAQPPPRSDPRQAMT